MDQTALFTVLLVAFRILALTAGALFVFLGYRLFKIGYFDRAGELHAAWGEKRIVLKQTAHGIFFALFGALVLGFAIWKPLSISTEHVVPEKLVAVLTKIALEIPLDADDKKAVVIFLMQSGKIRVFGA
jgi:hypothetical protein